MAPYEYSMAKPDFTLEVVIPQPRACPRPGGGKATASRSGRLVPVIALPSRSFTVVVVPVLFHKDEIGPLCKVLVARIVLAVVSLWIVKASPSAAVSLPKLVDVI